MFYYSAFLSFYLFSFRERGRKGEWKGEKYRLAASRTPPTGEWTHILGMCPDQELNQQPFGLQAGTQSTEPHQQGMFFIL